MSRHPERFVERQSAACRQVRAAGSVRYALAAAGVAALLILSACTSADPEASPRPTSSATTTAPAPTPTEPPEPVLVPDGTAEENLPFFAAITAQVWGSAEQASGRAYIDALTAAGFDKVGMQVTNDQSTVGNAAESIQFSVRWGEECLIGQVGPATGSPVTTVVPVLAEGNCLVGNTRPIDW